MPAILAVIVVFISLSGIFCNDLPGSGGEPDVLEVEYQLDKHGNCFAKHRFRAGYGITFVPDDKCPLKKEKTDAKHRAATD